MRARWDCSAAVARSRSLRGPRTPLSLSPGGSVDSGGGGGDAGDATIAPHPDAGADVFVPEDAPIPGEDAGDAQLADAGPADAQADAADAADAQPTDAGPCPGQDAGCASGVFLDKGSNPACICMSTIPCASDNDCTVSNDAGATQVLCDLVPTDPTYGTCQECTGAGGCGTLDLYAMRSPPTRSSRRALPAMPRMPRAGRKHEDLRPGRARPGLRYVRPMYVGQQESVRVTQEHVRHDDRERESLRVRAVRGERHVCMYGHHVRVRRCRGEQKLRQVRPVRRGAPDLRYRLMRPHTE